MLQEQTRPWALILIKPVLEVFEFRPADWAEKVKHNASAKGMLSCCKCLFEKIGANLAHIQPGNRQNVQKMRFFWQNALGVNGLMIHRGRIGI